MQYRVLGASGLVVSELALGCMTFGNELDEATARDAVDRYIAAGGNLIDTADSYHGGRSEEFLGRALRGRRSSVVVATKVGLRVGRGVNDVGLNAKRIIDSCHQSLRRLDTDYIDLYQLHCWDPYTRLEETFAALAQLVSAGKVRYVGTSNFAGWQIAKAAMLARSYFPTAYVAHQPQYSLVERSAEREVIPACADAGLGVLTWGPLGGGFLSGKYGPDTAPPQVSRLANSLPFMEEWWPRRATERNFAIVDEVRRVAEAHGVPVAQVALRWLADRPGVTSVILGFTALSHLDAALATAELQLPGDAVDRLDAVSSIDVEYPQRFINVAMAPRRAVLCGDDGTPSAPLPAGV